MCWCKRRRQAETVLGRQTADLSAELAGVLGVLRDLHLLDRLAQRCAVPRAVLTADAHLLRSTTLHSAHTERDRGIDIAFSTTVLRAIKG